MFDKNTQNFITKLIVLRIVTSGYNYLLRIISSSSLKRYHCLKITGVRLDYLKLCANK